MNAESIIEMLADYTGANVFNPWREFDALDLDPSAAAHRRIRLLRHFQCEPRFLLIGEAPGYQGCHFSGVPFTSETLICAGAIPRVHSNAGRLTKRSIPWSEPSATIIWRALHAADIAEQVVLWNAFAWHPHKPGTVYSNRAPTKAEIQQGLPVLSAVIERFNSARIVAIGKTAERTLTDLGVELAATIRHPANGGAKECAAGIAKLAELSTG